MPTTLLFRDPQLVPPSGRIGNLPAVPMTPIRCVDLPQKEFASRLSAGDPAYYVQFAYEPWSLPAVQRPAVDDDQELMAAWREYLAATARLIGTRKPPVVCFEHPRHIGSRRLADNWLAFFREVADLFADASDGRTLMTQFGVLSTGITEYHLLNARTITGSTRAVWCNIPGQWGFGRPTTLAEFVSVFAHASASGSEYVICWSDVNNPPTTGDMDRLTSAVSVLHPAGEGSPADLAQRPGEPWAEWLERMSQHAVGAR